MIIDKVELYIEAGNGGNGHVSFRREKYVPRGGPDGGNGGDGGSIYFEAVSDLSALRKFKYKNKLKGNNGVHGRNKKMYGENGKDLVVKIPVGTRITDTETDEVFELDELGKRIRIVKGGRGGRGNFEFRSNENKAPRFAEDGKPGRFRNIILDLLLIADIGLIGLPSAGKSSLLNVLTKADVRVGEYPFTTLEANLGELNGTIIADIPGLIEGAHTGKGLGIKFLKHIEKTKSLIHCIDLTTNDVVKDYKTIRNELEEFNPELTQKNEIILLTKSDLVSESTIKKQKEKLESLNDKIYVSSIIDDKSIESLKKLLVSL